MCLCVYACTYIRMVCVHHGMHVHGMCMHMYMYMCERLSLNVINDLQIHV